MSESLLPVVLDETLWFPDPRWPLLPQMPAGLVALGGDLSPERLLLAYRSGIFPWTVNPISWWSPNPRGIFELDQFHTPRSLERVVRKQVFEVTVDRAFRSVIEGCASAKRAKSWITPEFITAYTRLYEAGHAHSLECWQEGKLAGGIYGVAVGGCFAGESMFHAVPDASKVALYSLVQLLRRQGFRLFDIQMVTPITERLGAISISRDEYLQRLAEALKMTATFPAEKSPNGVEGKLVI